MWKISGANTIHGPDCIVAFVGTADEEVKKFACDRQRADAHLIAAAPDLLEALEGLTKGFDGVAYSAWTSEMHAAVAAIAKAKGETK